MSKTVDTNAKALRLNLDTAAYGVFAEIGGGQEVSRWFFHVGAAAGTVAKTMSAYDMAVSDAIYGSGSRYVSRERVQAMLSHEYDLLLGRLAASRGDKTAFFVFADTVATRSFKGGNESHGWIGLRFQHQPGAAPSDVLLHTALQDPTAEQQQQSLGILGVNLIHAAYYQRDSLSQMLESLRDGLTQDSMEIDVVECSGPAFAQNSEPRSIALLMLAQGLSPAVVFDETGRMEQPSTVFRNRALLVYRGSMKGANPQLESMLRESLVLLRAESKSEKREPLTLLELTTAGADLTSDDSRKALLPGIDNAFRPGDATMLTHFAETFRLSAYLRRYCAESIRFALGLDALITILQDSFYKEVDGGLLEALGRLLARDTKLYVFPMASEVLAARLAVHKVDRGFWNAPDKPVLTVDDISVIPPAGHLLEFLRSMDWLKAGTARRDGA